MTYNNPLIIKPRLLLNIEKTKTYQIFDKGLYLLNQDKFFSFEKYNLFFENIENDDLDFDIFEEFFDTNVDFLYLDNLEELKNTNLYKYTYIWKLKKYFENNVYRLEQIPFIPIFHKEFEYLIKLKLYRLALSFPHYLEFKNNFTDTFKVDKKYLKFMQDNDIDSDMLYALRLYPTYDIQLLEFISKNIDAFDYILNLKLNIEKVIKYIGIDVDSEYLMYYTDYLDICNKLKLDLADKDIIYPKDLNESYKKVVNEYINSKNKDNNIKFIAISDILQINNYEDDTYIIRPVKTIDELIEESYQQHNCVRQYYEKIIYNNAQIYFLRKKDELNKSFITIEVNNNKIVQALGKYNKPINEEMTHLLNVWENSLIEVV